MHQVDVASTLQCALMRVISARYSFAVLALQNFTLGGSSIREQEVHWRHGTREEGIQSKEKNRHRPYSSAFAHAASYTGYRDDTDGER